MKGLKWYSFVAMTYGVVACFINAVTGEDMATNLWAVALYLPVSIFLFKVKV